MNFFRKLFGAKNEQDKNTHVPETDGKTYIQTEPGAYILNKDAQPAYTYTDISATEKNGIEQSNAFLKDALAPLLKFDHSPVNHPANLDEYLMLWGTSGYGEFLGIKAEQHTAILAYCFGQYFVENYGMKWQKKSDDVGTQLVVRSEQPFEIELYPADRTLRAIETKELSCYEAIETKLNKTLAELGK